MDREPASGSERSMELAWVIGPARDRCRQVGKYIAVNSRLECCCRRQAALCRCASEPTPASNQAAAYPRQWPGSGTLDADGSIIAVVSIIHDVAGTAESSMATVSTSSMRLYSRQQTQYHRNIHLPSHSCTHHIYHINKLLYGRNLSAISNISFSLIYFHLFPPPLLFNFPTSLPM